MRMQLVRTHAILLAFILLGVGGAAAQQSPFKLQAAGDFAGTGMRSANPNVRFWITNSSPGDGRTVRLRFPGSNTDGVMYMRGNPTATNFTGGGTTGTSFQFMMIQFVAAVSRTDWLRNRELVPQLRDVVGGGWTVPLNLFQFGGADQWQAADGSVGRLHAGEQARAEGCFDHGDGRADFQPGLPLLAGSDCPGNLGQPGLARPPLDRTHRQLDPLFQRRAAQSRFQLRLP